MLIQTRTLIWATLRVHVTERNRKRRPRSCNSYQALTYEMPPPGHLTQPSPLTDFCHLNYANIYEWASMAFNLIMPTYLRARVMDPTFLLAGRIWISFSTLCACVLCVILICIFCGGVEASFVVCVQLIIMVASDTLWVIRCRGHKSTPTGLLIKFILT